MITLPRIRPLWLRVSLAASAYLAGTEAVRAGINAWSTGGPAEHVILRVAAGTPSNLVFAGTASGVFRSTDGGMTWSLSGLGDETITALTVGQQALYAGTQRGGLFKSTDGGLTWTTILPDGPPSGAFVSAIVSASVPLQVLYWGIVPSIAIGPPGPPAHLFRSADSGQTATEIGAGQFLGLRDLAIDPTNAATLYVATNYSGVLRSLDAGSSWARLAALPDTFTANFVRVDPVTRATLYIGGIGGIYKSTNAGQAFAPANSGLPTGAAVAELVVNPLRPAQLYAAVNGGGVFVSENAGATWSAINSGLTSLDVIALAIDQAGTGLHVGTENAGVFDYQAVDDPGLLSLSAAHPFEVRLAARDQRTGRTATGVAIPQNDLFGYFSLPALTGNPNNPEVFVKILDGTALNGKYWFFYGGLTDLEYTLTVTEAATGHVKTYTKEAGSPCGGFDTAAFP